MPRALPKTNLPEKDLTKNVNLWLQIKKETNE